MTNPSGIVNLRKAYLFLALATFFWAGNSVVGKWVVGHASPMVLVSVRWVVLLVLLMLFGRKHILTDWQAIRSRLRYLLFLGALGFTLFSAALYYALIHTTAINASILQGGIPLFVFAASFLLYSIRVRWGQVVGFACSFVGVMIIAIQGELANLLAFNFNPGDALVLVAVIAYGIYTAALRSKPRMHWISLMFVLCLGASLSSIPLLGLEAVQGMLILPDLQGWLSIAYIVIFPSLLSQVFFIRAVELIGANRAGLFVNLLPVWGALLAVLLIGESFHLYHGIALVLILAGIGVAEYFGRMLK